ncbi:MAG: UDP-N-acetylglucosamine 1-carboxyvinyltransferase [Clostridia bacterium]|nr:UDP-N-acetylglucosamine 1-carboxyvinyltransferase [Clostridia bacterium]MBP5780524.1 UDP-N-acetylglucosamine 1-carboxyvinyltransferase [Clostridia bacterium]
MDKYVIEGGVPLKGEVFVSGSKNAAVGILPAVLLADTPCTIENLPDIVDVRLMIEILEKIGVECVWTDPETVRLDPRGVKSSSALYDVVSRLRGSYYLMGALLGRFGQMEVSLPGGCNLGARPIDQHLKGFQALGVDINTQFGAVKGVAKDESGKLIGANIYLDIASVGATINLMLAAVKAAGQTVIENCAKEPHVVDVANFLNAMGANVRGAGTDIIKINGVPSMPGGITYSIIPDQIEAGTFMVAAAVTGGDVTVKNLIPRHQESLTAKLEEMNVGVEEGEDWIRVFKKDVINAANVTTQVYPGFPTDMQPQISVLLTLAQGTSQVTESVTGFRFQYTEELRRMGADIMVNGKTATIKGIEGLKGAQLRCPDLRAGAALVIAGLAAEGLTELQNIYCVDRGYVRFEEKLRGLGAHIARIRDSEAQI